MRKTVDVLGIPVDSITMQTALETVKQFLAEDRLHTIYTPNAEIIMEAVSDPELKKILCEGDMLTADGAGVVLGSKILGRAVPEKVSGIDLTRNIFAMKSDRKIKFYFFGGKPGVAEAAGEKILSGHSDVDIVGYSNGYFNSENEMDIINNINASGADILLVALGAPKQEKWIYSHKDDLKVKICIGVGGSLDVFAGKVKLAPDFFRRNGLEWLYRLYKEPWRFKRMLKLPKFILKVISVRIFKGK